MRYNRTRLGLRRQLRKPSEQPLILSRSQAAAIYFDYAITGIVETDIFGMILRVNPAAANITGYEVRDLINSPIHIWASAQSDDQLQQHLALLSEQGMNQIELEFIRRDGSLITVALSSVQIAENHFIHEFDDITEQKRALEAIKRSKEQAQEASQTKSRFLASISHELRTPLNGIIGLGQLALHHSTDQQQRDNLEQIVRSGQTLLQILNDLLDSAKIEAHKVDYEKIPFSLSSLLDELQPLMTQARADKQLKVHCYIDENIPSALLGDPLRIGQCLRNLLNNAIKFTQNGSITLKFNQTAANEVTFNISDTGIGISKDALSRIFTPFTQADNSTTRQFGGTGLGLYITRELAAGMGGELTATSTPGMGSTFSIKLPLPAAVMEKNSAPATTPQPDLHDIPEEFTGCFLLVAEDNPVNQSVISQLLSLAGITFKLAENGKQLLQLLQQYQASVDLILMDVQMPEMDGLQATQTLRNQNIQLPVIGLSAGVSRQEQQQCLNSGMNDFLAKPVDPDELWGCLTRWIDPHRTADSPVNEPAPPPEQATAIFIEHHQRDAEKLQQHLQHHQYQEILKITHSLKGSAATLGMQELASSAEQIESLVRPFTDKQITALIEQLQQQLESMPIKKE